VAAKLRRGCTAAPLGWHQARRGGGAAGVNGIEALGLQSRLALNRRRCKHRKAARGNAAAGGARRGARRRKRRRKQPRLSAESWRNAAKAGGVQWLSAANSAATGVQLFSSIQSANGYSVAESRGYSVFSWLGCG